MDCYTKNYLLLVHYRLCTHTEGEEFAKFERNGERLRRERERERDAEVEREMAR